MGTEADALVYYAMRGDIKRLRKKVQGSSIDLDARDRDGFTAMIAAVRRGKTGSLKVLIEAGADINARGNHGKTPLIECVSGHLKHQQRKQALLLLLESGADPDLRDEWGRTALHYASMMDRADDAKALVEHNANVNIKDNEGKDPKIEARLEAGAETIGVVGPVAVEDEVLAGYHQAIRDFEEFADEFEPGSPDFEEHFAEHDARVEAARQRLTEQGLNPEGTTSTQRRPWWKLRR
jgi:ankyrin repeat protein